jgi:hypothetical protein
VSNTITQFCILGSTAMRAQGAEWPLKQQQQINTEGWLELWAPYSDHRELLMDTMR